MENTENCSKYPSWRWIGITLVSVMIGITGFLYAGLASNITDLSKTKLDKEVYYRDMDRFDDRMDRLEGKADEILNFLVQHDSRDAKNNEKH